MKRLFEAFDRAGKELFLVGGAVRDLAMGHSYSELDDLDFATNASPEASLEILQGAGIRTYDVGIEFGTAGAILRGPRSEGYPKDVQITTYRSSETYRRGSRHPIIRFGASIDEDLWRRDFSINSIAMDGDGNYVDPYQGRRDIQRQVLRAVGDPMERLAEDPLRILRIARFMSKLGFEPDQALESAAHARGTWLLDIARQRWLQEMDKLLIGPHPRQALRFLMRVGAMNVLLPEVVALFDLHRRCPVGQAHADFWEQTLERVHRAGADCNLSWASLLADTGRPWTRGLSRGHDIPDGPQMAGLDAAAFPQQEAAPQAVTFHNHARMSSYQCKGVARRFHFDNARLDAICWLLEQQEAALGWEPTWDDAQVRRFVRDMNGAHEGVIAMGRLLQGDGRGAEADLGALQGHISSLAAAGALVPELPKGMGGHLMKAFSLRPGPILGELVSWLNEQIIEGAVASGLGPQDYINHLRQEQPPILSRVPGAKRDA
jgi:poly(A) polymerase